MAVANKPTPPARDDDPIALIKSITQKAYSDRKAAVDELLQHADEDAVKKLLALAKHYRFDRMELTELLDTHEGTQKPSKSLRELVHAIVEQIGDMSEGALYGILMSDTPLAREAVRHYRDVNAHNGYRTTLYLSDGYKIRIISAAPDRSDAFAEMRAWLIDVYGPSDKLIVSVSGTRPHDELVKVDLEDGPSSRFEKAMGRPAAPGELDTFLAEVIENVQQQVTHLRNVEHGYEW
jgi:hypothetical protein